MKKAILLLLAAVQIALTAAAAEKEYSVRVGQFDRLYVTDDVNVEYRCHPDSTGMVVYRGHERFSNAFIFTNSKGKHTIQVNTEDLGDPQLPTLHVYSDYLEQVDNSSDFKVRVFNPAPTSEFKATQIGNGTIVVEGIKATAVKAKLNTGMGNVVVSGKCETAEYVMIGTGIIQADRLQAEAVKCKIMGSGTIGCWARQSLNVRGIGSTKIYYKGDAVVDKKGGGKIYHLSPNAKAEIYLPAK